MYFRKYGSRKTWLNKCLKSPVSDDRSTFNMVNWPKHLFTQRQLLYHIRWSLCRKLPWKKSLVVTCKVFRVFVNTLTTDDEYSLLSRHNSMQTIQMHVWQKQKSFSQFLCAFFKSTWNFEDFQKKMTFIAYIFPKLRTLRNVVR